MRKQIDNKADILTPASSIHPLDQQTEDEMLEAYITATARFVKGMGFAPSEWHLVQIWSRKTKHGFTDDLRVSVNGEYIGETERPKIE